MNSMGGGAVKLQVVGINHVTAPVSIREQAGMSSEEIMAGYRMLAELHADGGVVVLSTCNRTEFYVAGALTLADILTWWEQWSGVERGQLSEYLYWLQDDQAIDHLFRVAAGVDSMIIGEPEILGQVKAAYQLAQDGGVAGVLHRVFQTALKVGKRARTETAVSQNALSLGHVVVELVERVFGQVSGLTVLILGAGDMAGLVARHIHSAGVLGIQIVNRTPSRGQSLAKEVGGKAYGLDDLEGLLAQADVIIAATKSPEILVSEQVARKAFRESEHRLRFFFDLSVPRNIDSGVRRSGREVFVYDIDDVRSVVEKNQAERRREADAVDRIVREEVVQLREALRATDIGPLIRDLRDRAEEIRVAELSRVMTRLNHLDDEERDLIEQATRLMINKILNEPMVSMRQWAARGDHEKVDMVVDLFHLRPEVEAKTRAIMAERRLGSSG